MKTTTRLADFEIRSANEADYELISSFIQDLAEYERLSHEVIATASTLKETLFYKKNRLPMH
jgi:hypothetical protein